VRRLNAGLGAGREETLHTLVSERFDHFS
jgi:hypothetical protein